MPTVRPTRDQVLGCLLGGALGDAWGGPYEGRAAPSEVRIPVRPILSDDTQLTLATCESMVACGRVDPENIAEHFVRWFRAGRIRGIGASTLKALRDLTIGTHWALCGARGEYAAGNGSAMRVAPLAFLLDPTDERDRTLIRDVCRITHHNDEAYVGALAVSLAIHAVLTGEWSPQRGFLACIADKLPDSAVRDRIRELLPLSAPVVEVAAQFGATGHVVDTVPLALYGAQSIATKPLEDVLIDAIRSGGDTDTIGSITGQVAGTVAGVADIPSNRLSDIADAGDMLIIAEAFAAFTAGADPSGRTVRDAPSSRERE